jgi:cyclophilin family peptidyl-prolyl cis-trans isomerase
MSVRARLVMGLVLMASGCASTRGLTTPSARLARVDAAESARAAGDAALTEALASDEPMLLSAALRALARTEAPESGAGAVRLLAHADPTVATWAAFALGQIGGDAAEDALVAALPRSTAPEEVLRALGRGGAPRTLSAVVAALADERPSVRAAASTALGLLARRHGKALDVDAATLAALGARLHQGERDERFGAAYALMRLARPAAGLALIVALGDADAEIRATAARGLGLAGAAPSVLDPVLDDVDARVRVEVARALALVGSSTRAHAAAAAARVATLSERELSRWRTSAPGAASVLGELAAGALALGEPGDRALEVLAVGVEGQAAAAPVERARLSCAVAFALDARAGERTRVQTCGDTTLPAWRRLELEARLAGRARDVEGLTRLTGHDDERVRAAAVEALSGVAGDEARAALLGLLESTDPYIAGGAAGALADKLAPLTPELELQLRALLTRLAAQADPGFVIGVLDALGTLGAAGAPFVPDLAALEADARPAVRRRAAAAHAAIEGRAVAPVPPGAVEVGPGLPSGRVRARLETARGPVEVVLFADVAPRTVARFLALAQAGYYRDRRFHRVVPDFVAQSGCPRGDGWGGPGEALLDETSPLPFVRGALGIATSGRDTGGSQFFVMHAYHPHLDGEYTLFGQVTSGMEHVDALVQDDALLDVVITER